MFTLVYYSDSAERVAPSRYAALGTAAEMLLAALLLERGHNVAVPLVDDDGVDLIVDYRTLVQVKTSGSRSEHGSLVVELRNNSKVSSLRPHIDVVAVFDREGRRWWFVPGSEVSSNRLRLRDDSPWMENWGSF